MGGEQASTNDLRSAEFVSMRFLRRDWLAALETRHGDSSMEGVDDEGDNSPLKGMGECKPVDMKSQLGM
jgi:hypothetical protein